MTSEHRTSKERVSNSVLNLHIADYMEGSQLHRMLTELRDLRAKVVDIESGWSRCSQACARLQDERDAARKELNRLTRGDVSNVITTLGDALTYIGKLERAAVEPSEVRELAAWQRKWPQFKYDHQSDRIVTHGEDGELI